MDSADYTRFASQEDEVVSQRGKNRDSLFLTASLTLAGDARSHDVRVRNLSAGGLMVEYDRPIAIGAELTLTLRGIGEVTGRVAWCAEQRLGVAFDRQIDPQLARKSVGGGARTPDYAKSWPAR